MGIAMHQCQISNECSCCDQTILLGKRSDVAACICTAWSAIASWDDAAPNYSTGFTKQPCRKRTCLKEDNLVLVANSYACTPLRICFTTICARLRDEKHLDPG